MAVRKYRLRPSRADHPLRVAAPLMMPRIATAAAKDLTQWFPGIRDQGNEGACTGFSEAQFFEIWWGSSNQKMIQVRRAPAYCYARARIAEGTFPRDSGAMLADGFGVLHGFGVCGEPDMPYDQDPAEAIPNVADADAAAFRLTPPACVDMSDPSNAIQVLDAGMPISIAIAVYQSFEDVGGDGVLKIPDPSKEAMKGGHGILIAGYDQSTKLYKVINQWGTSFGKDGFCFMPFDYPPIWEAWTAPLKPSP